METREAKHEPRSRSEQRAVWWQQAVGLLGERELQAVYRRVFDQQRLAARTLDDAWYGRLAATVISNAEVPAHAESSARRVCDCEASGYLLPLDERRRTLSDLPLHLSKLRR
ncbi:hypothetical protein [Micropruina sp.]|uniref:hypothetical protein n=1 Tax=Micropruina sp. TaxID=2737536 RepID=UPI00261D45FB|nr:hypothetical protein [Micropruina sp.]